MFALALLALSSQPVAPATPAPFPNESESRALIEAADAKLFYAAFEGCTPEVLTDLMLPEFRMIHDKGGLVANNRDDFVGQIERNCAERKPGGAQEGYRNRRLAVPGTRSIRRMGDWGVVESGEHVFFELRKRPAGAYGPGDPGGPDWVLVGGARYTHLWQWSPADARFRLSESISYDHGAALPYPPKSS